MNNSTPSQSVRAGITPGYQITSPEAFDFKKPEQWPTWIKRFERFRHATKLHEADGLSQVNTLIYIMGNVAEEILKSFELSNTDENNYDIVVSRFEKHFVVRRNGTYERAKFLQRMQEEGESVDNFITSLYTLSEYCDYGTLRDTMICDKIIHGLRDAKLAEQLQLDMNLTLEKAINKARQSEAVRKQQSIVRSNVTVKTAGDSDIERVRSSKNYNPKQDQNPNEPSRCKQCNRNKKGKHECPARNAVCNKCGFKGHYAVCCRTKKEKVRKVSEEDEEFLGTISKIGGKEDPKDDKSEWKLTLKIYGHPIKFKIDTGADVTVIPKNIADKLKIKIRNNYSKKLTGPADQKLNVLGCCEVKIESEHASSIQTVYVLDKLKEPLLGKPAIEELRLIAKLFEISMDIKDKHPRLFNGIGLMEGEYSIKTLPNAVPFALCTPRRIAIPLKEKVKKELQNMEKLGIIRKIEKATPWCSGMVVVPKRNGDVRICVDLIPLNKVVLREYYMLPSVDESLAQIAGAKYFSKLDAKSGFWQIKLSKESQLLTTFITPFGRYCFQRLPFGISSAPEYYQKRMSQILTSCEGVICHADDILIMGKNKLEHDRRLEKVLIKLTKAGVTLNQKCVFGVTEISFLGHIVNGNGIKPDPNKITAITKMPAPKNITELRRFNGMVQYVAKFVPNLATITQPLRELLKEDNEWMWTDQHDKAFQNIKNILTSPPLLAKYDSSKPTRIATDASSYGIGGVLEQLHEDIWKPVVYVSKSLTKTEQMYGQIEKECLAIIWGCEKLAEYITGKEFEILTDHQPLITVLGKKNIDELTPRLQRMKMKLMRFSYKIRHVPGKYMYTADLMSRIPNIETQEKGEDVLCEEIEQYIKLIDLREMPISDKQLQRIRDEQDKDDTLQLVIKAVKNGWKEIPESCRPYYTEREDFAIHQGILIKGTRLVIPNKMRSEILDKIHTGHLGISKCRERARETVWWPNISSHIKVLVRNCEKCCEHRINKSETMMPSELPDRPWKMVGMDLFKYDGKMYLVVVDYYSKYLEIAYVERISAAYIINKIKAIFARFGVPEIVRADNGTQFIAEELNIFKKEYGFEIITNSPKHSQSNGQAEAAVKIAKNILKKNKDPNLALMEYRNTPFEKGYSPSELLFGRKLRTPLPRLPELLKPRNINLEKYKKIHQQRKENQKKYFDRRHNARDLTPLRSGDKVWITDLKRWGKIEETNPNIPRSYFINTDKRNIVRNRKYLVPSLPKPSYDNAIQNQKEENFPPNQRNKEQEEKPKEDSSPNRYQEHERTTENQETEKKSLEPSNTINTPVKKEDLRRSSRTRRPPNRLDL